MSCQTEAVIVEPQPDGQLCNVTFSWTETHPDRPAHDVLVRLIALTDHAQDDGDLDPYLLDDGGNGEWSGSLRLPSDLRTSYQLCPVRDRPATRPPPGRRAVEPDTRSRRPRSGELVDPRCVVHVRQPRSSLDPRVARSAGPALARTAPRRPARCGDAPRARSGRRQLRCPGLRTTRTGRRRICPRGRAVRRQYLDDPRRCRDVRQLAC